MRAPEYKRDALDIMASMFVDHIFDLATSSPALLLKEKGVTAGPRDTDADDGAYANDDVEERISVG